MLHIFENVICVLNRTQAKWPRNCVSALAGKRIFSSTNFAYEL